MVTLENKLALVTGAAGVLGRAVASRFIAEGMRVVAIDLAADRLATLADELGANAHPVVLDLGDERAIDKRCAEIRAEHGDVDVLVNNAGLLSNNKAAETSAEEWRRLMRVNLDGAFYLCRAWLPGMKAKGWGRIVNVCSLAMKTGGLTAGTAYTASKGGLGALTFSLAREAAAFGVTVNGVAPAYIETPMVTEQLTEEQREELLTTIPVGRFCQADEVAALIAYLASPIAGFITGEIVDINGGLHLD
jgi:3-oxoacyl-[acyl-carrier protein] reductase